MKYKNLIVTGSLSFDHIMAMPGRFKDHILPNKLHIINVSFIMDKLRTEYGGTGGNISYSLSLLKTPSHLIGTVGHDFGPYHKHLKLNKRINISKVKVYQSEASATGFAMTDRNDNQIWGFYQGAMKYAHHLSIRPLLKRHSFVVIAPDNAKAMSNYSQEAIQSKADYMFDPAFNIIHFPKSKLRQAINGAKIIIGNDYEISLLEKTLNLTSTHLSKNKQILITTLGAKGSIIRISNKKIKIPPAKVKSIVDPTGAGDAYRAGFIAGYIRGFDLDICGKMGSVAAAYTVETYGTQTHAYTLKQFKSRYKSNYQSNLPI